ncbi:ABC transporter permease [Paludibaculum fermentans]|uniref:ABC transporter permease n=1 Tax=Paludibaculum fermentans TaxID=1473598 RepID=UPI003EB9B037
MARQLHFRHAMQTFSQDLRSALRSFVKNPLFTAVVVLSLGLGIGANTAIFTLTDQVLLRLLPVKEPRTLVQLKVLGEMWGASRGAPEFIFSHPMFLDLRQPASAVFTGLMARFSTRATLRLGEEAELAAVELVSGDYFEVLGVGAAVGRTLTSSDNVRPGAHPVVVLGYRYWKERCNADPTLVGKTIRVDDHPMTVVGVSQAGFDGLDGTEPVAARIPLMMKSWMTPNWDDLNNRRSTWLQVFGRLRPGVSAAQAQVVLDGVYHNFLLEETKEGFFTKTPPEAAQSLLKQRLVVAPAARGFTQMRQAVEKPLRVLTVLVGLVLLIACANVSSLLLARAEVRRKEMAVRLAMGASRARLLRQLLVESLALSLCGGALGTLLSIWCSDFMVRFMKVEDHALSIVTTPDLRILAFTAIVSLLTGVLFGFIPAWRATRLDLAPTLKDQGGRVTAGAGHLRLRRALVVAQVALSVLLLVGAGLFGRSLGRLRAVDPGFQVSNVVAFTVDPSLNGYAQDRVGPFFRSLESTLRSTAGVQNVALTGIRMLASEEWHAGVRIEGYQPRPGESLSPLSNGVSGTYFETIGLPLLAGRTFDERDAASQWKVAIINRAFALKYFGRVNVVGRRIALAEGSRTPPDTEVIGVVENAKYLSLRETPKAQVFWPYQRFLALTGGLHVMVRTQQDPGLAMPVLRQAVARLDAGLPVFDMRTLEAQREESLAQDRLLASLALAFSTLAALLAALGLYGILAYMVQARTNEIGIRMALGAGQGSIVWMVARQLLLMVGIGAALGMAAASGLVRLVSSQLYGMAAADPASFALALGLLAVVGAAAGLVPSIRAARVDPIQALKYE